MENKLVSKEWLQERQIQIKKEKDENSKYVKLRNGENIIKIDLSQRPIEQTGKFGKRYVWQTMIEKNGQKLLLSASATLDSLIIQCLSEAINPFTLIKVGEGKDTRYDVKEFQKE